MTPARGQRPPDDDIEWFTISYKTLYIGAAVLLVVLIAAASRWWLSHSQPTAEASPEAAGSFKSATFTSIEGTVKVKAAGVVEWVTADLHTPLNKADLVRTGSNSSASITFSDGTVVQVRPDSLITIEETTEDAATHKRKVAWHISSGDVNYNTGQGTGAIYEVSTPTLRFTAAEQTDGGVRVKEGGDSDVSVFKGSVEGRTKTGDAISLGARQATKVDTAGKAGPRLDLPPAPNLIAPPHQAEVAYPDPTKAITVLVWQAVPVAAAYHVQLDQNPYFNRPLLDTRDQKASQLQIHVGPGKYYWRVAAIDRNSVAGPFSEFSRFTVTQPSGPGSSASPPPLALDSLEVRANIVQLQGRTEPGTRVSVNGQNVEVAADGSFNEFIKLEKLGEQEVVIVATGRDGGVAELRRKVVTGY